MEQAEAIVAEVEAMGGMARAVATGMPKRRIEEAATRKQARIDAGTDVIVGVNKYTSGRAQPQPELRVIDNTKVRAAQVARLAQLRASRDGEEAARCLRQLTAAAASYEGNLLELSIAAARARCTVGEISAALEQQWGRFRPAHGVASGVYLSEFGSGTPEIEQTVARAAAFEETHGRRPRILVAKMGQDGHDRGANVIASAFADLGFDVDVGPLFATPAEVALQAMDADVHVVGVSSQAAAHLTLVPQLVERLRAHGSSAMVVCGGVIPTQDYEALHGAGVAAVFGPGTRIPAAAQSIIADLSQQLAEREKEKRDVDG